MAATTSDNRPFDRNQFQQLLALRKKNNDLVKEKSDIEKNIKAHRSKNNLRPIDYLPALIYFVAIAFYFISGNQAALPLPMLFFVSLSLVPLIRSIFTMLKSRRQVKSLERQLNQVNTGLNDIENNLPNRQDLHNMLSSGLQANEHENILYVNIRPNRLEEIADFLPLFSQDLAELYKGEMFLIIQVQDAHIFPSLKHHENGVITLNILLLGTNNQSAMLEFFVPKKITNDFQASIEKKLLENIKKMISDDSTTSENTQGGGNPHPEGLYSLGALQTELDRPNSISFKFHL